MAIARALEPPPVAGCTPLFNSAAMRAGDRRAVEEHRMPSLLLMEHAGTRTSEAIRERFPGPREALVLAGSGNNGGDGLVVARQLADHGWAVRVQSPDGRPPTTPDASVMTEIAATLGIDIEPFSAPEGEPDRVLVDAVLGTGIRGAPRGPAAEVIEWLSRRPEPVVAVDVPSGVEADSGAVSGAAVRAALTVTYGGDMIGLHVAPGRAHAGEVRVVDIGIPGAVALSAGAWRAGPEVLAAAPRKAAETEKYGAGAVLVIAGAPGLIGAGCLAARAALRAGAGLAVLAAPRTVQPQMAMQLTEVMVAPLPDADGHLVAESVEEARRQAGRVGAVALGPGLGRADTTQDAVRTLAEGLELPLVVDADGLWHLGERPAWLRERRAPTVLTPHSGEAGRLLGRGRAEVDARRLDSARELSELTGAVVALKGPGTVVCAPSGAPVVDACGTAALATAGTGDVLTGVVAAHLAAGLSPFAATIVAVARHGVAGVLAARGDGTLAGDVVDALPEARAGAGGA